MQGERKGEEEREGMSLPQPQLLNDLQLWLARRLPSRRIGAPDNSCREARVALCHKYAVAEAIMPIAALRQFYVRHDVCAQLVM